MYSLPVFSQLILLLHWVLVTINDFLAGLGLGYSWTWGLAIIGLTIIVRLILFPLTWKQYKSAQEMQLIQPQIKQLQKKYKNDRGKIQEETMKLYSEHHVNPFASCLPLLLQLPVFISLYAAIKGLGPLAAPAYQASVQALNQAPFLWLPNLGNPDPYYILLVLYVVSQMISTELMVATQSDNSQKWIMRAMPIMFVLFLFHFPAGLFVYWVTTNVWTIGQQVVIRRTMPKPADLAERGKAKPKKRSRFMEALMASQGQAMKQREEAMAKKKGDAGSGATKKSAGASGAKKTAAGRKPPPGKGKTKAKPGTTGKAKPGTSTKAKPGTPTKAEAGPDASSRPPGSKPSGQVDKSTSSDGPAAG